jgi:hypothetical protein
MTLENLLTDIQHFCALGSRIRLRSYQLEVALAVLHSINRCLGRSIVVQFPRQSGKNEVQAQIEAYLLALLRSSPVEIIKVSPTWKPQAENAMRRLERVLSTNPVTKNHWKKESGHVYRFGKASITFLSGSPNAHVSGATASLLLECDEAQEVSPEKWLKDFAPMAASTNATTVFWGTAWTADTLIAQQIRLARQEEEKDGFKRCFHLSPEQVAAEVPAYGEYLKSTLSRLGRHHPMVRTQFYGEEIESEGSLFPSSRLALMQGNHPPCDAPTPGCVYSLLLDVAGEAENSSSKSSPLTTGAAGTAKTSRDATALTVVEIDRKTLYDDLLHAPTYRVVHRKIWTGVPHTELYGLLNAQAEHWKCKYFVVDATGLGVGLASFLGRSLGFASEAGKVIPFNFTASSKSKLGWDFLSVIDSGRFKDYMPDSAPKGMGSSAYHENPQSEDIPLHSLFHRQASHCRYEVSRSPSHTLRWGVSPTQRDPLTGDLLHDDLLISAALCTLLDKQDWSTTGDCLSAIIPPTPQRTGNSYDWLEDSSRQKVW